MQIAPSVYTLNQTLEQILFPAIAPYDTDFLQVSDLHSIWYAQYGNPKGVPVVFLHGGPGIGCSPNDMRYFDPNFYRIINFDQRGAKRSKPAGEIQDNNTQALISDIEALREHLEIQKWFVLGGSWGSALALLYGQAHANRCLGFVLRGVFLARQNDADNIWLGMRDIFPEEWDKMQKFLPIAERDDLISSYCKRLLSSDPAIRKPAAHAFMEYDLKCGLLMYNQEGINKLLADEAIERGGRLFSHYYQNNFFIQDNQILDNLHKIKHLPAYIVHGRYDIICRLSSGFDLHQQWPGSELLIIPDAGHTAAEPGIAKGLVTAMQKMQQFVIPQS